MLADGVNLSFVVALGSAVFTLVLFILFSVLLEVQTPRGLLY